MFADAKFCPHGWTGSGIAMQWMTETCDNPHKLLILLIRITPFACCVFDPAFRSGNFLVIAYKELRAI